MPGYIHHVQWSVSDLAAISSMVRLQYGMREVAVREREVVLQSGSVVFLLSQAGTGEGPPGGVLQESPADCYPWLSSGGRPGDSVFNICLEVGDVRETYQRMTGAGSLSISPPRDLSVEEGTVSVAVVSSPCSQVIHSLVNTTRYSGRFLPGFTSLHGEEETEDLISHIDHITLVCEPGDSRDILAWYSTTCGMQPFLLAQEDLPGEGTVFQDVGMKLNVSSWVTEWLCREEGVTWEPLESGLDQNVNNFKLVVAEPLAGQDSHVNTFLRANGGPGVQHLGLATADMTHTVTALTRRGAVFRKPPHTYYNLPGKQEDILRTGQDLETFKLLGILIDREPTEPSEPSEGSQSRVFLLGDDQADQSESDSYLLQIFSFPLFQADTFFLEIIQRHNSSGFGNGNIKALAQSLVEVQRERDEVAASLTAGTETNIVKSCSQQDLQLTQFTSTIRRANSCPGYGP